MDCKGAKNGQKSFLYFWMLFFYNPLFSRNENKISTTQVAVLPDLTTEEFHSPYITHLVCTCCVLIWCIWWILALKTVLMYHHNFHSALNCKLLQIRGGANKPVPSKVYVSKSCLQFKILEITKGLLKYSAEQMCTLNADTDIKCWYQIASCYSSEPVIRNTIDCFTSFLPKTSKRWHRTQQS